MRKFFLFLLFIIFVFCSFNNFMVLADNRQTVTVVYLERIGDTPFAKRVTTTINIPVYENHTIKVSDVAEKIGNNAYGVMVSYCDKYTYDVDNDCYVAEYHKSVYLNAITTDAHIEHYFLDINKSYCDYYSQFVLGDVSSLENSQNGISFMASGMGGGSASGGFHEGGASNGKSYLSIIPAELYDYYLNRIHVTYPQLNGMTSNEIYGYFGWIAIPHSNSINDILATQVFSLPDTFDGVLDQVKYQDNLSRDAYDSLMNDYGYSWFQTVWSEVLGTFGIGTNKAADFYMFFANGEQLTAFVAQNGASDMNDSNIAIANLAEDLVNNVGDFLNSILADSDKIFMLLGGVLGVFIVVLLFRSFIKVKSLSEKYKNREKRKK